MEKISIGIEKRISLNVLELALRSALDGTASSAYFYELANAEGIGKNRAKKTVAVMNRMTMKNKLLPHIICSWESCDLIKEDPAMTLADYSYYIYHFKGIEVLAVCSNSHFYTICFRDFSQDLINFNLVF